MQWTHLPDCPVREVERRPALAAKGADRLLSPRQAFAAYRIYPFLRAHPQAHLTGLELGQSPALASRRFRSGCTSCSLESGNHLGNALQELRPVGTPHTSGSSRHSSNLFYSASSDCQSLKWDFAVAAFPTTVPGSRSQSLVGARGVLRIIALNLIFESLQVSQHPEIRYLLSLERAISDVSRVLSRSRRCRIATRFCGKFTMWSQESHSMLVS